MKSIVKLLIDYYIDIFTFTIGKSPPIVGVGSINYIKVAIIS